MRIGVNPSKLESGVEPFKMHRVIVPVYIPNSEGYFEHAVEILKLSLESLWLTTAGQASLTVISNGCMPSVVALLREYLEQGRIHQLILNVRNWGKIDAALSASHGRFEQMLTISDADVLFRPGWLAACEAVLRAFPECGFVTPCPNPTLTFTHTSSTILAATLRRELDFEPVVPAEDLDRFAHSIGRPDMFTPEQRRMQLVVRRPAGAACVGGGHFVFTMRREVVWRLPQRPSLTALRPLGEVPWFDEPPDAMGVWRLSTTRAYAYHLGNVPEPWMYEELDRCRSASPAAGESAGPLPAMPATWPARTPSSLRRRAAHVWRRAHIEPRWARAAMHAGVSRA